MSKTNRQDGRTGVSPVKPLALMSVVFAGAMFGFFFAWVCSTIWGLDATDADVAITAMRAMNASVRNWVFALAFFGTPVLLIVTALVALRVLERRAASCFALAGLLYVLGAMVPTMTANVPLNEALALVEMPLNPTEAQDVWRSYSGPWQFWNVVRTVVASVVLALAGWGISEAGAVLPAGERRNRPGHAQA